MSDSVTEPQGEEPLDKRVSSLEAGQDSLSQKLDRILGIVGGGGHDEEPTDQPAQGGAPNIAHEIRQQLDERDRKKADDDRQAGLHSTVDELKTKVSELTEKPPAPLPRRIEKLMGWS
jgi:hypothetical protein